MKNILLTFFSLLILGSTQAQIVDGKVTKEYKKSFLTAIGSWYDEDFRTALSQAKDLSDSFPNNAYLKFVVGDCYIQSAAGKANSIKYLEEACDSLVDDMTFFDYENPKNTKAPFAAVKQLGIAYRINYEFEKAIAQFNRYEQLYGAKITSDEQEVITREKNICNKAIELVNNPVKLKITNIGPVVNSAYGDYAPVVSADEKRMIFTSRRGEQEWDKAPDDQIRDPNDFKYYEDIYITDKGEDGEWQTPKKISENINTVGHEGSIGLSVDGQQLLIYSSQEDFNGDIYLSTLEGDVWSVPVPFKEINSNASEEHACFNVDGTEVYFSSNRTTEEKQTNDFDIYKITKLPNGEWSLPINLGPTINTKYDEKAPFIHPDGVTLYFASNGHPTIGGYDIFKSSADEETFVWATPENVGYPINTTVDDLFYVTSVDGQRGYYSSEKLDGHGEKDLYIITLVDKKDDPKALTVMTGIFSVGDDQEIPEDALITVRDVETGEIVGVYRPNRKTGKYLFILPPGKTYDVSYEVEGFLFKSENVIVPTGSSFAQVNKPINLAPVQANESIVLNNVFFVFDKDKIIDESKPDLEKLAKLLRKNTAIVIEISGHTDSKGNDAYNMKLSKKRAIAVRKYLIKNGVAPERMTAVGYGETQPIARNENPDGSDNEEGRQLNRRIELKILATDGKTKTTVKKIAVPNELQDK